MVGGELDLVKNMAHNIKIRAMPRIMAIVVARFPERQNTPGGHFAR
jgi:hypothetical protein